MIISFVTKMAMPGERGVCFAIATMCRAFAKNGHDVELIFPNKKNDQQKSGKDFWGYFQIEKNLYKLKPTPAIFLPKIAVVKRFQEIVMSWSYSLILFCYLLFNRRPYVHLFTECKELLFLLRLFSWLYSPKVCYEVHILPQNLYDAALENWSVTRADLVVTTTSYLAQHYEDKVKKVVVLPNGINPEDFDYKTSKTKLRRQLGLPEDKIIVGYGGRFVTNKMEKGIPELIEAVAILKRKHIECLLVCVGGPAEYVKRYQLLSKKCGLISAEAVFIDHVPPTALYKYMRAFDICVMPFPQNHHFAHVMAPLKMFEYMASKNPIVGTDLPSVHEVLTDKENTILAKPSDSKDLARAINLLIVDKGLGRRLASRAFEIVMENYTWKKRQKRIIDEVAS